MASPKVLYVSYDGALEPLGRSQIVPYLLGLASRGALITLLSFEKRADWGSAQRGRALRTELASQGIRWTALRYHKRPRLLATAADLLVGLASVVRIAKREKIQFIHARSYVAAFIAWMAKRILGLPFVFDMRGFWADERLEAGLISAGGLVYRFAKRAELHILRDADEVITLTERARQTVNDWLRDRGPSVTVIPTCVDLSRFSPAAGSRLVDSAPVFVYAGSLGTWYALEEMLRFVEEAARRYPRARFLLLTPNLRSADRELARVGPGCRSVALVSASPAEVARWLRSADAGLAFYRTGFSRQGTCPTKIGEYLATGLPVVVNEAVGDMKEIVGTNRVGTVLADFSGQAYALALDELEKLWADPALAARCRSVAESYFSLQAGVDRYWAVYRRLA